ncbi:S41 family peptidase [Fulvivirgaceae bacterium BMA12]|uniref:S41 family peptidase n=1 Tax=Agaribacillus aureus TaxID=3051825 RepID=A0ABT8KYK8_9BACT|nr:S41 family peptidase [Fulvivirgaceae bacterium BMA12]
MKALTTAIFFLIFNVTIAQDAITISGRITDKLTAEGLAYVHIYLEGTSFGISTNRMGEFTFKGPANAVNKTLIISHLGYKTEEIKLEATTGDYLNIQLAPQVFELQEVVVEPINPLEIIYAAIDKIPENYYTSSYTVQGFQREYVTSGKQFIQLMEVAFQSQGTFCKQSSRVLDARYIEDKKEKAPLWDASRGGFYTLGWTKVSGIKAPSGDTFLGVNLKNKTDVARYYKFEMKESISLDNREVYVIAFDQKKKVKRPLLKGTLYIDGTSYAIIKLTYELSPKGAKFLKPHRTWGGVRLSASPKKIEVKQDKGEISYKKIGRKWFMSSWVTDARFDASLTFLGAVLAKKNDLEFHSERIVTAVDTIGAIDPGQLTNIGAVGSMPTLQNFIKKNFEGYHETAEEKWTDFNFIKSDTAVAQIAARLRLNNEQWKLETQKSISEKALSTRYTSSQLRQDLRYLKASLEKIHPGLYWYTDKTDFDKAFEVAQNDLKKKTTEAAFFQMLSPIIEMINCGHTAIYPSTGTSRYMALHQKRFPLDLWISGDRAVVTKDHTGIAAGSEVVAINGKKIPAIIHRIKSNVPTDGYNTTYKDFRLQQDFADLYARYFETPDEFEVIIQTQKGESKTLTIAGKKKNATVKNNGFATSSFYEAINAAVLTIPSFASNQDFLSFLEKTFQKIEDRGIRHLAIDLRNNQGGRDHYGAMLFSYLTRDDFDYYDKIEVNPPDTSILNRLTFDDIPFNKVLPGYPSQIEKRDGQFLFAQHQNLGVQRARPDAYQGQVYILINGGTFSAAAEFAAIAYSKNRAVFIGQETGGGYYGNCSFGTPFLTLPNSGIKIAIPLSKYKLAVSQGEPKGHGVIPHYQTKYSLEDIMENQDKELAMFFELVQKGGVD